MKHGKTGTMSLWEGALAAATQELSCEHSQEELDGQKTKRQNFVPILVQETEICFLAVCGLVL